MDHGVRIVDDLVGVFGFLTGFPATVVCRNAVVEGFVFDRKPAGGIAEVIERHLGGLHGVTTDAFHRTGQRPRRINLDRAFARVGRVHIARFTDGRRRRHLVLCAGGMDVQDLADQRR